MGGKKPFSNLMREVTASNLPQGGKGGKKGRYFCSPRSKKAQADISFKVRGGSGSFMSVFEKKRTLNNISLFRKWERKRRCPLTVLRIDERDSSTDARSKGKKVRN